MALAPKFAGQKLASSAIQPKAVHTLELCQFLYSSTDHMTNMFLDLDYVYTTGLRKSLLEKYGDRVVTIFRQQIQPWHPSSTLVHEAGYAVQKVDSAKFYEFSAALFDQQKDFFDVSVVNETRNATYKRLAKIAGSVGVDEKKVYELLEISDKPAADGGLNTGNKVTDDLKVQVKANRMTGVHVTPTVVFDGVVNNEISSGWSEGQWEEWLEKNVK
jgi:protein-disulfide isomerase